MDRPVFFIWLSIFNLFVVSIFWATIVDVFSNEQGRRLFRLHRGGGDAGRHRWIGHHGGLAKNVPTWG